MKILSAKSLKVCLNSLLAFSLLLTPHSILVAQSALPNLGDDTGMTLGAERRLGDEIAREIYRDPEYLADPILDAYLTSLWLPLMASAKARGELAPEMQDAFAWKLFLVRDKSINAFALPGAYFGVHLGLMALVETPDELASVLAHELTHVTQRHIARGMNKQAAAAPWFWASIIAGLLAARSNPQVANAVLATGQAGAIQNQLNFTRDMEREADRIGYTLMDGAGYAPSGFVAMFNKLAYAARFSDNGNFPYLRSHPLSTTRIADMTQRVGELDNGAALRNNTTATPDRLLVHSLMSARARVLSDLSVDAQKQHLARAEAILSNASAANNVLPTLYAGALAAGLLKEVGKAQTLVSKLQALELRSPEVQSLIRWLAAELGHSVNLSLASDVRIEVLLAAKQSIAQGLPGAAAASTKLRSWLGSHPQDAEAWELLSAAQLAQNQRVRAAISRAQSQSTLLNDSSALAHYLAAQNLIRQGQPADAIDSAIVDSKVRELQRRVREHNPVK